MSIHLLSASLQDAVELERWELVDVDVGPFALLGHSEVLQSWVNANRTDTIGVAPMERLVLLRLQVVGLILVAGDENDGRRVQEVDIVTFH